jgi:hypothetical protein
MSSLKLKKYLFKKEYSNKTFLNNFDNFSFQVY